MLGPAAATTTAQDHPVLAHTQQLSPRQQPLMVQEDLGGPGAPAWRAR